MWPTGLTWPWPGRIGPSRPRLGRMGVQWPVGPPGHALGPGEADRRPLGFSAADRAGTRLGPGRVGHSASTRPKWPLPAGHLHFLLSSSSLFFFLPPLFPSFFSLTSSTFLKLILHFQPIISSFSTVVSFHMA